MKKLEFSKILLIQESILLWIVTIASIILAYFCIMNQYLSDLPWITAMVGLPWATYGVSQAYYYKKSAQENTAGGIKFESVMSQINSCVVEEE